MHNYSISKNLILCFMLRIRFRFSHMRGCTCCLPHAVGGGAATGVHARGHSILASNFASLRACPLVGHHTIRVTTHTHTQPQPSSTQRETQHAWRASLLDGRCPPPSLLCRIHPLTSQPSGVSTFLRQAPKHACMPWAMHQWTPALTHSQCHPLSVYSQCELQTQDCGFILAASLNPHSLILAKVSKELCLFLALVACFGAE